MTDNYVNQEIKKTVHVEKDVISYGNLESLQAIFPLKEADYLRLKSKESKLKTFSGYILGGVVGYVLNLTKNIYDFMANGNENAVQNSEWLTIIGGTIACIICWLLGEYLPNERTKVMKNIDKYFDEHCSK
ncbi:TPA: hypothetical protein ACGDYM_002714 [Acinetobacter baumannii]|uniref:hypothetical protein n=1 Tax=Acinetobacter baumannii TaxID=470 RepID=UPI0002AE823C|nr:hypothetical protein [Acinetobacter baumannii]ELX05552.1 hypothetical protein ACINNAV57_1221 [Acinetobacter baumannii Naval-57]MDN8230483.1 hypothetical protein [Acinetobacter baumannii]MDN8340917.1 hypothetical protein [Acinetobacter baumannii]TPT14209.1 hypothetical protein FJU71_16595 [Acinetobacter baumannii]HAV2934480.1 hypothetical protein [Acinetobacter baumannii]